MTENSRIRNTGFEAKCSRQTGNGQQKRGEKRKKKTIVTTKTLFKMAISVRLDSELDWENRGEGFFFHPKPTDIGKLDKTSIIQSIVSFTNQYHLL